MPLARIAGILAVLFLVSVTAAPAEGLRITKEEARKLLGAPKTVFVDGRTESAWYKSDRKVQGAVRIDKWDLQMWASPWPEDTLFIIY